ncbi:MAG: helix-turn-helix domain-containing protein [Prochlorotrichaceae cyanobacterium]
MIRWRLNEVMARYRVLAKDLADFIGVSSNVISNLRKSDNMPRLDGERLEQLCIGITKLSKIGANVTPYDLIAYLEDEV